MLSLLGLGFECAIISCFAHTFFLFLLDLSSELDRFSPHVSSPLGHVSHPLLPRLLLYLTDLLPSTPR